MDDQGMIFTFTASLPAGVLYDVTLKDSYGDSWGFGIVLKLDACDGTEINTLTYDECGGFSCFEETFQVCVPGGAFTYSCECTENTCANATQSPCP